MHRAHPRTVPRSCRTAPHADVARGTAMSLTMLSPETCVRPMPRLRLPAGLNVSHGPSRNEHELFPTCESSLWNDYNNSEP